MRKMIFAAFLTVILLSGCKSDGVAVTDLPPEVLTGAIVVEPETVYELPDTVYAGSAFVYKDRYAVCVMQSNDYSAEVYDLIEGKIVGRMLHYGNGPQEVLFPKFALVGDTLQVHDLQKGKMYMVPCDGFPDAPIARQMDIGFTTVSIISCGDSLLSLNPYYFENDDMGIHNGEPLLFYTDGKKVPYDSSKPWSLNIVQGGLTRHPGNGRVVFADHSVSEVVFLDEDLVEFRRVTGPVHGSIDYVHVNGVLAYDGSGMDMNAYLSLCSDREYIYLLYDGRRYAMNDDTVDWEYTDHDLYLFQMDWDGELLGSYVLKGVDYVMSELSCGAEPGTVYVSAVSPDEGNLEIFFYDLRKYN